jgi:hypothetical protein
MLPFGKMLRAVTTRIEYIHGRLAVNEFVDLFHPSLIIDKGAPSGEWFTLGFSGE